MTKTGNSRFLMKTKPKQAKNRPVSAVLELRKKAQIDGKQGGKPLFPPREDPPEEPILPPDDDAADGGVPEYDEFQLLGSICRESFKDFLKEFWHIVVKEEPLVWNWHMEFLCDELQAMAERVFKGLPKLHDLIINISPGTSKSTIASIMFPVWCWTRMASMRIISASYRYDLATILSRKSRDVVKSELYQKCFPGIDIRDDQDSKGNWVNTAGGERFAIGVDGGVMGQHAHIIIVDDPLDPKQAASEADLKTANRWMEETLPSRKVNKAVTPTILIMQRLHQNDPTGARLEKRKKVPVRHICLPAELTNDVNPPELRDKYVNGLMDPVRLGWEVLAEAEAQGDFVYAAQYLQTPIPRGTQMFDVTQIVAEIPPRSFVSVVRYWDKAGTMGGGTFTVGAKVAKDHTGRFWVLDIVRGQWDSGRRERKIQETARNDGKKVIIYVEQEPGSGGKDSAAGTIRNLAGYVIRAHKVGKSDGDKIARADAFSSQVNNGNVSICKAMWNADFLSELQYFPNSKYKDQVDATSGGFNHVAQRLFVIGGRSGVQIDTDKSDIAKRLKLREAMRRKTGRRSRAA